MKTDDRFYAGIICALAVIAQADEEGVFEQVLNTIDVGELIDYARRSDNLEWSGLVRYGYVKGTPEYYR